MPFQVLCAGCGNRLNVKDEWEGKRLRCPKCSSLFAANRAAAAADSPPAASKPRAIEQREEPERKGKFELPFTLGPDDRYPRLLYWGLLIYCILDAIFAVPIFLQVVHENANMDYHGYRLIGWAMAMVIPPGVAVAIVLAISTAAIVYACYKFLLGAVVLTSAMGASMAGTTVEHNSVTLQTIWHFVGIVLAVWYFFARRD